MDLYELSLLGYCLMSNHVHLVGIPRKPASLGLACKQTHGRYAAYWNASNRSCRHEATCRKHNARIYARKDSKGEYFSAEVGPPSTCVWGDLKSISPEKIERAEE